MAKPKSDYYNAGTENTQESPERCPGSRARPARFDFSPAIPQDELRRK
jgi:hypothetical protein